MLIVFGSLNLDMVMRVEALPRPGETILCPSYQLVAGGKGANQAVAASKSGVETKLFGRIGDDDFGKIIFDSLNETSIDLVGVSLDKKAATGCATITVEYSGENMITVAGGANLNLKAAEVPDFLLGKGSTLLLQMETKSEENWQLIQRAKKFGAQVILNLAPASEIPREILDQVDVLIVNQHEATRLGLLMGYEVISATVVAKRIAASHGNTCIVTLGSQGAMACTPEGNWEVKAMEIKPIDTTAAGDAFVGVLAASLDEDLGLQMALRRASVASSLACLHNGAQISLPTNDLIESNLSKVSSPKKIN